MKKDILKIRGHHLLCMQGFQGYGYSQKFVDKMNWLLEKIRKEKELKVEIIKGCDDLCLACPNKKNNCCMKSKYSDNEVLAMDEKVLRKLDVVESKVVYAKRLFAHVNTRIRDYNAVKAICGDCSWRNKCLYIKKLKNGIV